MTDLYQCPRCGREYRADKLASCPGCSDESIIPLLATRSADKSPAADEGDPLVWAIDRTTYAVRALALFFFFSLGSSLLGFLMVLGGAANSARCAISGESCGSEGWVFFGYGIIAVGFVASLAIGLLELRKSKP